MTSPVVAPAAAPAPTPPTLPPPRSSEVVGIGFLVAAVVCFGALDTSGKVAAASVPVALAIWARYVVQNVLSLALMWPQHGRALFRTAQPRGQALRALLLVGCNGLAFLCLRTMHVGEFTAVMMLTPLLMTVVAAWGLGERVSLLRWLCLLGGFAGTLLVIRPSREVLHLSTLLPLVLVVISAAFQVLTRTLARTDLPETTHVWSGIGGLLLTSLALPWAWETQPLSMWLMMGLMGVFGGVGHYLLALAYSRAGVATLTPFLYLQVPIATLGGWLVFQHLPDGLALAGILVVCGCGVFGTWLIAREQRAARQTERDPAALVPAGEAG
ncbi:DMT family transporter [Sphaerotilus mobilis]|uniref:Drug/metabolite transporter (DMT)-like permease n=1 Tax=Sphaerotilus mobilis TaxID=47994 RepID=A0A4Q7LL30_9BURK|nr:DMT family transporter [Sphaerotilus mobilis]RZS54557.1 drug/metabolite transporter (DMT)-like permease [Sphaerotilus mobilis]